MVKLMS